LTPSLALRLIEGESARRPQAVVLARHLSLAVSIELELVRAMRLLAMPGSDAGIEADLYFGPLVSACDALSIVLIHEVRNALREQLRRRPEQLRRAEAVVREVHAGLEAAIRTEEAAVFHALSDGSASFASMQRELGSIVRSLQKATPAAGLVRWAHRSFAALPERARRSEAGQELARLLDVHVPKPNKPTMAADVSSPPSGRRAMLSVEVTDRAVKLSAHPQPGWHSFEWSAPSAHELGLRVELAWPTADGWNETVVEGVSTSEPKVVPQGPLGLLRLRSDAGHELRMRPSRLFATQRPKLLLLRTSEAPLAQAVLEAAADLDWDLDSQPLEAQARAAGSGPAPEEPIAARGAIALHIVDFEDFEALRRCVGRLQLATSLGKPLFEPQLGRALNAKAPLLLHVGDRGYLGNFELHGADTAGAPATRIVKALLAAFEHLSAQVGYSDVSGAWPRRLREALLAHEMKAASAWLARQHAPDEEAALGAVPSAHGTSFRLWAPRASSVVVKVEPVEVELERDLSGVFSGFAAGIGAGDAYQYFITGPGIATARCDPRTRALSPEGLAVVPPAKETWPEQRFTLPPLNELIICQLHVGTFNASAGSIGTFDSVRARLRYLSELGVTAVLLQPIAEFPDPEPTRASPGYGASHLFAVKRAYGGPKQLRQLVDQAHAEGIAVLLEVVYTHLSPQGNVLWNFDGESADGGSYYEGSLASPWGQSPAFWKAEVRQFISDNARMWLQEYGIDGLYFCGGLGSNVGEPGHLLLAEMCRDLRATFDPVLAVEALQGEPALATQLGLDAVHDVGFTKTVRQAMVQSLESKADVFALRQALWGPTSGRSPSQRLVSSETFDAVSADQQRLPKLSSEIDGPGVACSAIAAVITFTAPGIPLFYQGQELMADDPRVAEAPLDWSENGWFFELFRRLVHLRRDQPALRDSHINVFHLHQEPQIVAFHRWSSGSGRDDVIVVLNLGQRHFPSYLIGAPYPGPWVVHVNTVDERVGGLGSGQLGPLVGRAERRDGLECTLDLMLEPRSAIVLCMRPEADSETEPDQAPTAQMRS
jgi:1,4-alpha-glucan branching enzyme